MRFNIYICLLVFVVLSLLNVVFGSPYMKKTTEICFYDIAILNAQDSVHKIQEVKIYGSKRQQGSYTQQTLTQEDIKRRNPLRLGDAIKQLSGVNVKDYGGIGGMQTVSVRSLGANHTAVEYDGILLSDAQNGQIDLSKIPIYRIAQINLYNAQSPSIFKAAKSFASATLLSVESIYSTDWTEKKEFMDFKLTGGSFGFFDFFGAFGGHIKSAKPTLFDMNISYTTAENNYPFEIDYGGEIEKLRRDNSDIKSFRAEASTYTKLNSRSNISSKFMFYGAQRGLPGAVVFYDSSSHQRLYERTFLANVQHTSSISEKFSQKTSFKYNFSYSRFLDNNSLNALGIEDNKYHQHELYFSTVSLYTPNVKGLSFSASLDAAYNYLDANLHDFVYPNRYSLWFNVAAKYEHDYIELTANGLFSSYFDRVSHGDRPDDKIKLSPSAAISIKPFGNKTLYLRAFYKDIFRMPTFNDLYYSRVGNTDLVPENARQINVGLAYYMPSKYSKLIKFSTSIDFYKNYVTDKIVAYPTKDIFIWSMFNVGKVEITGIDYSFKFSSKFAAEGLLSKFGLSFNANYTYQKCLDKTDKESRTYNNQIAYTPVNSASLSLGLIFPYVSLSYSIMYSGYRYYLNENIGENLMPAYFDHGISIVGEYQVLDLKFNLGIDCLNITNKQYEIVKNYPMPLANFRVFLRLTL